MNKIMNDPANYDRELAAGFIKAFDGSILFPHGDLSVAVRKKMPENGEVAIVGVCDGGHMPAFAGYIGEGLLHGASIGETFKVPSADDIFEVIHRCNMGKGVIIIPLIWNKDLDGVICRAREMAEAGGIRTRTGDIRDDCLQPRNTPELRKGSAGVFFALKIASAAAADGRSLEEITDLISRVNNNTRTATDVGGSFCLPGSNKPFMQIDEGKMQVGVGMHGEPGFEMVDFPTGYEIAEHLFRHRLNAELQVRAGEEVAIMINDAGSATIDELLIIYQEEARQFEAKGVTVVKPYIGRYVTTLDMDGVSISAIRLNEEMKGYLLAEADAPFFRQ